MAFLSDQYGYARWLLEHIMDAPFALMAIDLKLVMGVDHSYHPSEERVSETTALFVNSDWLPRDDAFLNICVFVCTGCLLTIYFDCLFC